MLADVIHSDDVRLAITARYPATGMPPVGAPFAIDVELESSRLGAAALYDPRNWFKLGGVLHCSDTVVVARGLYEHRDRIWALAPVSTSTFAGCRGTARMIFSIEFRPDATHWIKLQVFPAGTTAAHIAAGRQPIAESTEFLFNRSQAQMQQTGTITAPTQSAVQTVIATASGVVPSFDQVNRTARHITFLALVGAGIYFTLPFWPDIQRTLKASIKAIK
jgi:hypothetical protein